jgi:hypothetical protein
MVSAAQFRIRALARSVTRRALLLCVAALWIQSAGAASRAEPGAPKPPAAEARAALGKLPGNTALDLGPYTCTDVQGESPGKCKLITDYSGMVFDRKRREFLVFGGGHASTNYDAVNAFNMKTLTWSEKYAPTGCSAMVAAGNFDAAQGAWRSGGSAPYPRPAARHTVDLMVIAEDRDELILLTWVEGNGMCAGLQKYTSYDFRTAGKVAHYALDGNQWTFSNALPERQWPAAEYDPISKKIIMLGLDGLMIYDPATRAKSTVIDVASRRIPDDKGAQHSHGVFRYNNHLVYFPPNQKMYYFDRADKRVIEVTLDRNNFSNSQFLVLTTSGTPSPHGEPGYAYDSVNEVIGGAVHDNKFYAFNPLTKSWTAQQILGGSPGSQAFHAIGYDDTSNVFVFLTTDRRTWAYRYGRK